MAAVDCQSLNLSSLPWLPLEARASFPRRPAIYFAIDANGVVQYIGRSKDPRVRWNDHHKYEDLSQIGGVRIAYLFVEVELLREVEFALIAHFDPPLNVVKPVQLVPWGAGEIPVSQVKALRESRTTLTQRQLGDLVGVTESTISNWEAGRNGLEWFERVANLCKALKCTPEELIKYVDSDSAD